MVLGSIVVLSDGEIIECLRTGEIVIDPLPDNDCMQPASIDVRLGDKIISRGQKIYLGDDFDYLLMPGEFILGHLLERVTLSSGIVCRIEGKSSNGRRGLGIHITAGFVDPGWDGNLTLEMYNFSQETFYLSKGMKIAQLAFDRLGAPALRPYGHPELNSKYQGDTEAQTSKQ